MKAEARVFAHKIRMGSAKCDGDRTPGNQPRGVVVAAGTFCRRWHARTLDLANVNGRVERGAHVHDHVHAQHFVVTRQHVHLHLGAGGAICVVVECPP